MPEIHKLIRDLADPDPKTVTAAVRALLARKEEAVEPLMVALDDKSASVRIQASYILAQCSDPRVVPMLIGLSRDPEARVRFCLASHLGSLRGRPEVVDALLKMAREEGNDAGTRRRALLSLDALGASSVAFTVRLEMLQGPAGQGVNEAATDLGKAGDPRAVQPLIDLLRRQPANMLVLGALGRLQDPQGFAVIVEYLAAKDPFQRAMAAQALGESGDPAAVEPLRRLLSDASPAWQENHGPSQSVGDFAREALAKLKVSSVARDAQPWWKVW